MKGHSSENLQSGLIVEMRFWGFKEAAHSHLEKERFSPHLSCQGHSGLVAKADDMRLTTACGRSLLRKPWGRVSGLCRVCSKPGPV